METKSKEIRVAFFGDSICFGQGISIHRGWVAKISQQLESMGQKHGFDIVVTNAGVNGNTTRLALERMPYDIQAHRFHMILLQFGMNDCNYWRTDNGLPRVSQRAFEANLNEIIDRLLAFGARKIMINTNHPTTRYMEMPPSTILYQESNAAYNRIVRKVAEERNDVVELNDIEACFKNYLARNDFRLSDALLPDQLHLSATGHDIYYSYVFPKIKLAIEEIINE